MASNVLELNTKISVSGDKALTDASKRMGDLGTRMGSFTKNLVGGIATMAVAGAGAVAGIGAKLIGLAATADTANAKLSSTFVSMGANAWTTGKALDAQAQALDEMSSAFDVNAIKEAQSVMLTFGNVTGPVFENANKLVVDMAEALGTDLQSASIQVGKALNDPVQGVSALSEVGVSFTEDQKEMIKTMVEAGDVAGAQAIIMGELSKQFGGTAEAIANTPMAQMKQDWQDLQEPLAQLGSKLLPLVSDALGGITAWATEKVPQITEAIPRISEKFSEVVGWVQENAPKVGDALSPVVDGFKAVVGWVGDLVDRFKSLDPEQQKGILSLLAAAGAAVGAAVAFTKIVAAIKTVMATFEAMRILMAANPWTLLIGAIVALVVLVVMNWDKIKEAVGSAWEWIKEKSSAFGTWITDFFVSLPGKLRAGLRMVGDAISAPFVSAFNWVADAWNNTIGKLNFTIPDWVPGIGGKSFDMPDMKRISQGAQVPDWRLARLASGGVVTGPTLALVGEAGPEAVIPLDRLETGRGMVVNINVPSGAFLDPVEAGRQIAAAVRSYERAGGRVA